MSIVSSEISVEDRQTIGERARENTPISAQADWEPAAGRLDPVELLIDRRCVSSGSAAARFRLNTD